jgi:hypothetical protein
MSDSRPPWQKSRFMDGIREVLFSNQGPLTTHPDRLLVVFFRSSSDVAGMVSRRRAGLPKNRVSIPGQRQEISHSSKAVDWLWSPTSILVNARLGVKRHWPESHHSYHLASKLGMPPWRAQEQHTFLPGKHQIVLQTIPRSFLSIPFQPIIH